MSSVRMCDRCGTIFSERESGWQTGQITTVDDQGSRQVAHDLCPDCAVGTSQRPPVMPTLDRLNPRTPLAAPALAPEVPA